MALKFGKNRIVLMDSTHGTNNMKCPMYTIMVVDEHGHGHPVACRLQLVL
jgi:hypothetical protein